MTKNLYVGNMNYDTTQGRLVELFEAHGQVSSVKIITDYLASAVQQGLEERQQAKSEKEAANN